MKYYIAAKTQQLYARITIIISVLLLPVDATSNLC